jgi:hypothetical protein
LELYSPDAINTQGIKMENELANEHCREVEDQIMRDLMESSRSIPSIIEESKEPTFDPFEEHTCEGGGTETWLVPGGREFWLIFKGEPELFTWIEYCPYCGYHPPNLRLDWGNPKNPESF